ncbi:MAG: histidine phosphatase family protein [Solirubrobacteraceae bacterium MAG38_C4-C5]|nr:histidine phosphatase family protein [Candidatus Siliceabacter maunaloa]
MSQQLWLLRHGEAERHDARPDAQRRLTRRGERQSATAGRALAALGLVVHDAFTSPKVRALNTARLACAALGVEPVEHAELGEGFDVREALTLVAAAGPDRRVLLVGHNPDLAQVVHDLTGARINLKKGGVAGIALDGSRGELLALLRPRELAAITGGYLKG